AVAPDPSIGRQVRGDQGATRQRRLEEGVGLRFAARRVAADVRRPHPRKRLLVRQLAEQFELVRRRLDDALLLLAELHWLADYHAFDVGPAERLDGTDEIALPLELVDRP